MMSSHKFSSKKSHLPGIFGTLLFFLCLKICFSTVYDDVAHSSTSISEEEKLRRRNIIQPFSRYRRYIEKDWIESYHEIYSGDFRMPKKEVARSKGPFSQGKEVSCSSESSTDFTGLENWNVLIQMDMKNVQELKDSTKTTRSEKYLTRKTEEEVLNADNRLSPEERQRRLEVLIAFRQYLPDLDVRGEYIPIDI